MKASVDVASILGFDPADPGFLADPYPHYRRLDAAEALRRTPGGLWVTTSYDLCGRVLRDARFGHRPEGVGGTPRRRSFLTMDPPDHTRLRRLVGRAFTARMVERIRPRAEAVVDGLLAGLHGEVDLIEALAYPLPVILISELLGVPPEDHERFRGWSAVLARSLDPEFLLPARDVAARDAARLEFSGYFRELLARRRAHPADDLLSALVAVSADGDALTEEELLATCVLLLVAGHETTVNLIGNGALALLRHPAGLAWFRAHPEHAPAAIEELLRYDPPVQLTLRSALEDVPLAGTLIRKGEPLLLLIGAAGRDPAVFTDPDRFDPARYAAARPAPGHLAFGHGIHFCLGAPLARLEGRIALTRLMERDVALVRPEQTYRDNLVLRGLAELPVTLA